MPIKSDIVNILSKRFPQLTVEDVNLSVNIILNEIGNAMQQGRKAEFREFGVFTPLKKASRTARKLVSQYHQAILVTYVQAISHV